MNKFKLEKSFLYKEKIPHKKKINKLKLNRIFRTIKKHFLIQKSIWRYKPLRYFGWSNRILKGVFYKQAASLVNYLPKLYYSKLILLKYTGKNISWSRVRSNNYKLNQSLRFSFKSIDNTKWRLCKNKFIERDRILQAIFVRKTRYISYILKRLRFGLIKKSLGSLKSKILKLNRFDKLKRIFFSLHYKLPLQNGNLSKWGSKQIYSYITKIPKIRLLRELRSTRYKFYFKIRNLQNYIIYNKRFGGRNLKKNYIEKRKLLKIRGYNLVTKIDSKIKKKKFINQFKQFRRRFELNKKKRFSSVKIKDVKLTLANFKRIRINRRLVLTLDRTSLKQNKGAFKRILADVKKNKNRKRYYLFLNKKENNIFLTCTDYKGNVISSKSAGDCKIKTKKKKKSPDTVKAVSKSVTKNVKMAGIKFIYSLYTTNWYTKNIKLVLREFTNQNIQILTVKALINKPHSLVMKRKKAKRR